MKYRALILAACAGVMAGCGGGGSDDSPTNASPGPEPAPSAGPGPAPAPEPIPEPAPSGPAWVVQDSGSQLHVNVVAAITADLAWSASVTASSPVIVEGGFLRTQDGSSWELMGPVPEGQSHIIQYSP